jgi:Ca2+-binding EF-hand superfamily protein
MSVHDETWNKCEYCHKTIHDWDHIYHTTGTCLLDTVKNVVKAVDNSEWNRSLEKFWDEKDLHTEDLISSHSTLRVCQTADEIIEIFGDMGFTSDSPVDIEKLRHLITESIQKNIT